MDNTLTDAVPAHTEPGVEIRILLAAHSFGRTDTDPNIAYVEAYAYRDQHHPFGTPDEQILEHQFVVFNGQEPCDHATAYYAGHHRSLSVDDIVTIDDRAYRCDSIGWTLLASAPAQEAIVTRHPPQPAVTDTPQTDLPPDQQIQVGPGLPDIDCESLACIVGEPHPTVPNSDDPEIDLPPF